MNFKYIGILFILMMLPIASASWEVNNSIVSGLTDVGDYSSPTVFTNNSILYLISGNVSGQWTGFNWTGTTWQSDTNIVSGLTGVGSASAPTVFTNNSILYLISGNTTGLWTGFNWTGTTWRKDTNIVSGLTDVGIWSSPTTFTNNSILYLISGNYDSIFTGFNWTGTTWQSDTNIVSGLTGVGILSYPSVFTYNSILYLISGNYSGQWTGFNWTGTTWRKDTNIVSGLTDVGDYSSPTVFTNNSILYLISGNTTGLFTGFSRTTPASITNLQNSTTSNYINWTWTNPTDIDFNYVSVYINSVLTTNTSNNYYLLTPISIGTNYTISTHTVDTMGNVNTTWVNNTVNTTTLKLLSPANTSTGQLLATTLIWQEYPTDDTFTYQISTDYQFINIISQGSGSDLGYGDGTYSSGNINLQYETKYFWHVKNGTGTYINSFEFTTITESQIPGELNITVFDETNLSKRILNFTIDLYNATSYLTNSTTNGWVNFSGAQVITGEYLIIVTPKEGSNNYYSRMVLADSPYNVTMYVPNSTSPNTINLISFSLLDTTGLFPFQISTMTVSKGGLVQDKSYFSADGTHPVYMLQGTNYQISITHGDNIQNFANFVPLATGTSSITINDFTIEEYTVNPFVYNITYTPSIITLKWNDFNNVMSTLNYTIRKGIAQTLECSLVTGVNSGQSECGIDKTTIYFVIFSATMGDGTFRNTSFVVDYSIVDGARTSSTGTSTIDSSSIGTGFLWNYETFVMPIWVYNWASLILIILLAGSFGGYHSGFGAIVTLIVALFLEALKFFRPLGEDNTVVMGITGALLVIAIFYYMQHKDKGG